MKAASEDEPQSKHPHAWAKLQDDLALPLADHGEDVAAVLRRLLEATAFTDRLGHRLTPQVIDRLCALAFLHDLGKANAGFWRRQSAGAPTVGHTEVVGALLKTDLADHAALDALGPAWDWGLDELVPAVLAHHGRPLACFRETGSGSSHPEAGRMASDRRYWAASGAYDPMAELARLLAAARDRFPLAFEPGPPLPSDPRVVALLAGLMTLADWIGSDARRFPVGSPQGPARLAMARAQAADAIARLGLARLTPGLLAAAPSLRDLLGQKPYEAQDRAGDPGLGRVAVLEAETGSGKTEAALWRFLRLAQAGEVDGLYFALPTRTAAVQIHRRINALLCDALGEDAPSAVLAVPGYLRAGDDEGQALAPFEVLWPDGGRHDGRWAAEAPKRFLAARVAVGTIDQALLAGLQAKHAHLRAAALSRSLLVVDEVHASDAYMTEVLTAVLRNHAAVGGHALLLSATLGGAARAAFLGQPRPSLAQALAAPYPALSGSDRATFGVAARPGCKAVRIEIAREISDAPAVAALALAAARDGASVLVVRNTVADAVATARALEGQAEDAHLLFRVNGVATLHHGRFAPDDRRLLDAEVEAAFGKPPSPDQPGDVRRGRERRPMVVVGSQTLEQSLDIDADLLIVDLAPMDVLLQRIGRLHRHARARPEGFEAPRCVVLAPEDRDLRPMMDRARHGLGPLHSGRGVYSDLTVIEATWALLEARPTIVVPDDCRELVERATHPDALRLIEERDERWRVHATKQEGGRLADVQLARGHRLDLGEPFTTLLFPQDEAIRTRLGADDRLIDLDPPRPGPFGAPVARLRLPGWMADGIGAEPTVVAKVVDGALHVAVDGRAYVYDRLGLRTV